MKAICRACGHQAHNLKPHFQEGVCPLTLKEYVDRYPGERLTSELFDRELLKLQDEKKPEADNPAVANDTLTPKTFSAKSLFGTDLGKLDDVSGFLERSPLVPDIDPDYIFPDEATKIVLIGLITNRPTLVHGPTGTGKSSLIEQVCARLNYPVMRVNHHADMYTYDILGQKKVEGGRTLYEYGPLPQAMRAPTVLILDEWDALNPEIGLQYQSVLEKKHTGTLGSLVLTANDCERVESHPQFRIVATSNTAGLGDDSGHYQGTQHQNLAFVSRFLLRVQLNYLTPEHEANVLLKRVPDLTEKEARSLAKVAKLIREQHQAGKLDVPFSIRDLINWAELYAMVGDEQRTMIFAYTSILPYDHSKTIYELIQREFGKS